MKTKMRYFLLDLEYYCWDVPRDFFSNIKWFFKNLWNFRKVLVDYRPWDYCYCIDSFSTALEQMRDYIYNHGNEEDEERLKKVEQMEELLYLLDYDPLENNINFDQLKDLPSQERIDAIDKADISRQEQIKELLFDKEKGIWTWWD
jgi:hypothetical protein